MNVVDHNADGEVDYNEFARALKWHDQQDAFKVCAAVCLSQLFACLN